MIIALAPTLLWNSSFYVQEAPCWSWHPYGLKILFKCCSLRINRFEVFLMLFHKRFLPDYLQMLFLRKLKIVSLWTSKFGIKLPCFMGNSLMESGPRVGLLNIATRMSPRVLGIEVSVDQLKRRNGSTNNQKAVWEVSCHRWARHTGTHLTGRRRGQGSQAPAFSLPTPLSYVLFIMNSTCQIIYEFSFSSLKWASVSGETRSVFLK